MRITRARMMALVVVAIVIGLSSQTLLAGKVNQSRRGLGVKGYDVVAYFRAGEPMKGHERYEHVHDGVTYRFVSAEHRDLFASDPGRYLPQYGGFCAYAVSRNYTADIDPTACRVVAGKLYLNYDHRVQARWAADVPGNIAKGDANWPALSRK